MGDWVRIVSIPDLKEMERKTSSESFQVFKFLLGKYKKVKKFDRNGLVWFWFKIRKGRHKGLHGVGIEPYHLRVKIPKRRVKL